MILLLVMIIGNYCKRKRILYRKKSNLRPKQSSILKFLFFFGPPLVTFNILLFIMFSN